jgi:subtilisin family serine protease
LAPPLSNLLNIGTEFTEMKDMLLRFALFVVFPLLAVVLSPSALAEQPSHRRYVIRFHAKDGHARFARDLGPTIASSSPLLRLPAENSVVMRLSPEQVRSAQSSSQVLDIEEDVPVSIAATPDDTSYGEQYGLALIGAPQAWDRTVGSRDVIIGVVDTGIDYLHPDLVDNVWVNAAETPGNGVDDDGNGLVDDVYGWNFDAGTSENMDDNGHGTHVSGTIGATGNNALGVTGVAWNVRVLGCKGLDKDGSGFFSSIAACIDYLVNLKLRGENILAVSMSLGGNRSSVLERALVRARDAGLLVVAAAGNESANNDRVASFPANFALDNIISVAAVDSGAQLASFSNFGVKSVDLAAPGVGILSTLPREFRGMGGYGAMSGTSMATPHVSGAAALVASINPALTAGQIREILLQSVTPAGSLNRVVSTGGILNVDRALQLANGLARTKMVAGSVVQGRSKALKSAYVKIRSLDGAFRRTTVTDITGSFRFDTVPAGSYVVTASKREFSCRRPARITLEAAADAAPQQPLTCVSAKK